MSPRRILRSATKSLANHILFIEAIFTVPMSVLFIVRDYQFGELTPWLGLWIVAVSALGGAVVALVGWYVILPSIHAR